MNHWKRKITLYIASQLVTQLGTSLVSYAIFWYITLETRSGLMITLYTIFGFLPTLLLSPFAGVWADRYNRKRLIIFADVGIAASSLVFALVLHSGQWTIWLLFLVAAIRALGSAIQAPASNALVPQMVPEESLVKVNGWMSSATSLMGIVAPIAGAALLTVASLEVALYIDVITAGIGVAILHFLKVPLNNKGKTKESNHFMGDMIEGLRYIRGQRYIRSLFFYFALFFFFVSPAAFLTPLQVVRVYGEEIFRLTAIEIGFFLGMLAGGALIGIWGGFKNRIHTLIFSIVIGGGLNLILGVKPHFVLYVWVMVLMGISVVMFNAPTTALLQEKVPEEYTGRVFGVLNMISTSMFPIGLLLFGPLADGVSIEWIMLGTGIILILQGLLMTRDKELIQAGVPQNLDKA